MFFANFIIMKNHFDGNLIEEILEITDQLIELAKKGNENARGERSRLFFGGVLDDAFKVNKNAKLELGKCRNALVNDIDSIIHC